MKEKSSETASNGGATVPTTSRDPAHLKEALIHLHFATRQRHQQQPRSSRRQNVCLEQHPPAKFDAPKLHDQNTFSPTHRQTLRSALLRELPLTPLYRSVSVAGKHSAPFLAGMRFHEKAKKQTPHPSDRKRRERKSGMSRGRGRSNSLAVALFCFVFPTLTAHDTQSRVRACGCRRQNVYRSSCSLVAGSSHLAAALPGLRGHASRRRARAVAEHPYPAGRRHGHGHGHGHGHRRDRLVVVAGTLARLRHAARESAGGTRPARERGDEAEARAAGVREDAVRGRHDEAGAEGCGAATGVAQGLGLQRATTWCTEMEQSHTMQMCTRRKAKS